jgi:hypothetical protein
MKTFFVAAATLMVSISPTLAAGPFGFEQGASPTEYGCVKTKSDGIYTCDAPKPHPAFEKYAVQAEEGIGICWVKGIGKDLTTSGSGTALRGKAEEIASQIASTYGKYTDSSDTVTTGSIWREYEDWTMASLKDELIYYFQWKLMGAKQLNGVKTIFVSARATGRNEGFALAEFAFKNEDQCDAAKKKREAGAF